MCVASVVGKPASYLAVLLLSSHILAFCPEVRSIRHDLPDSYYKCLLTLGDLLPLAAMLCLNDKPSHADFLSLLRDDCVSPPSPGVAAIADEFDVFGDADWSRAPICTSRGRIGHHGVRIGPPGTRTCINHIMIWWSPSVSFGWRGVGFDKALGERWGDGPPNQTHAM